MMNTQRTPAFYMANLGAEVSRALSSKESGDVEGAKEAIARGLLIIEKVLSFDEMKSRSKEIDILKSVLENITKPNFSSSESQNLKSYFYPFASRIIALS